VARSSIYQDAQDRKTLVTPLAMRNRAGASRANLVCVKRNPVLKPRRPYFFAEEQTTRKIARHVLNLSLFQPGSSRRCRRVFVKGALIGGASDLARPIESGEFLRKR